MVQARSELFKRPSPLTDAIVALAAGFLPERGFLERPLDLDTVVYVEYAERARQVLGLC